MLSSKFLSAGSPEQLLNVPRTASPNSALNRGEGLAEKISASLPLPKRGLLESWLGKSRKLNEVCSFLVLKHKLGCSIGQAAFVAVCWSGL